MIGPGARGPAVADIQRRLQLAGYPVGPIDGVYGEQTHKALMDFQGAHGLSADGIVGPQTEALFTSVGQPSGQPPKAGPPGSAVSPDQDPQYLAFMRGMGYDIEVATRATAMRQQALDTALADEIPTIALRGAGERDKIASDFSDRGMWNSGGRVQSMQRSQAMQQQDMQTAMDKTQQAKTDLEAQLLQNVAQLRLEGDNQLAQAAARQSLQGAAQGQDVSSTPSPQNAPVTLSAPNAPGPAPTQQQVDASGGGTALGPPPSDTSTMTGNGPGGLTTIPSRPGQPS